MALNVIIFPASNQAFPRLKCLQAFAEMFQTSLQTVALWLTRVIATSLALAVSYTFTS